jgi:hypothetical protein
MLQLKPEKYSHESSIDSNYELTSWIWGTWISPNSNKKSKSMSASDMLYLSDSSHSYQAVAAL